MDLRPPSDDADASPRWRRRKDARPSEIISAAYAVFAEKGFAAARLDDIARRADLSKGALYLYFATKQDLFAAVVREAIAPDMAALEATADRFTGSFADLARLVFPQIAQVATQSRLGRVVKMVIGESGNFPELAAVWHDQLVGPALDLLSRQIARGQMRGEVRNGDARAFAVSLIAPILLAVLYRETFVPIGGAPFDLPALTRQHLETILPGLLLAGPTS